MPNTLTVDQAKEYLKICGGRLNCLYEGRKCRLFYNKFRDAFCVLPPGQRVHGVSVNWSNITYICAPVYVNKEVRNARIVRKYITKAQKASFSNGYIRKCLSADTSKSPFENGLTTGVSIDGDIITLDSVAKTHPFGVNAFKEALRQRKSYNSGKFEFRGYDTHLWLEIDADGEIRGGLSLEYRNCANGRYYLLINDNEFIGYDID